MIGRGATGRVYRGSWSGMRVAIKVFPRFPRILTLSTLHPALELLFPGFVHMSVPPAVAAKVFAVGLTDDDDDDDPDPVYESFKTELELLRRLNHDNLLRVYTAWTQRPEPYIVTELMAVRKGIAFFLLKKTT